MVSMVAWPMATDIFSFDATFSTRFSVWPVESVQFDRNGEGQAQSSFFLERTDTDTTMSELEVFQKFNENKPNLPLITT